MTVWGGSPEGAGATGTERMALEVRTLAGPLRGSTDLDALVERVRGARFVCVGEASHGTSDYYRWRALLSRRLVEEHGFTWIGVEGDWPDCWRINRWVRGEADQDLDAVGVLDRFERWPTWMWANREVAEFLTWLHAYNLARPESARVGFYGLDVYSLWDSLWEIMGWLEANAPESLPAALRAWQCFVPYGEDPHQYARSTRLVPAGCEADVVRLLVEVRGRARERSGDAEMLDVVQNAEVATNAEHYYRTMVRGDRQSWNVRDHHMVDTVERLSRHGGPRSQGIVWEHNTHVGDARATDMAREGLVNVGQLLRERHPAEDVALVGFASHRGTVLAADSWGAPESVLPVPVARAGSLESLLHETLGAPALLVFPDDRSGPWLSSWLGHRAIGVVYHPEREVGNYVPTRIGARYDALLWLERTTAVHPLHHEARPTEPEFETEPTGF
ncbi:erythromycin esterase family protein [Terrabacter sp. C0L_2]|uniref:erythromycin esterase family protein n=1 Tax=Terrabacter sp. C0L_2 TaxID=3108389 RepID=UPI002ED59799|nr:erythromycin esterase family protein [Terrabacter sp. C0L_2]